MSTKVKPIPDGFHSVTPYLIVNDAAAAIDFYKRAFGAVEMVRFPGPGGTKILHAALRFGDSVIYLSDEFPDMGSLSPKSLNGASAGIHLYVENVDAVFDQAVAAGATVRVPLMNIFWGDRYGRVKDPFGYEWALATHVEDLTPEEIGKRSAAFFAQGTK